MRTLRWCLAAALLAAPIAAHAGDVAAPGGRAGTVAISLARQTGSSIVITDRSLARRSVPAIRGRMPAAEAVRRLAAALGARAVATGARSWRIEPAPAPDPASQRPVRPPIVPAPQPPQLPQPLPPIVVQASKRDLSLEQIPAQVSIIDGGLLELGGAGGTEEITRRIASVSSTYLGSGRNKLFIRGIADSSFTGPTQSTVGQYWGDLRLSYNAPDPDLRLSDLDRVEVLEGPQGTLYGAGALGGIIRLVPNQPRMDDASLAGQIGGSLTQHGSPGGDLSLTANLPAADNIALRATIDAASLGGYIDKPEAGREDVNRTNILGGRLTGRVELSPRWSVELTGLAQTIDARDAQYADRGDPPLTSTAAVTEGADIDFALGSVVISGGFGGLSFRSTTGIVRQDLEERYDAATDLSPDRLFVQTNRARMAANETRLWSPERGGFSWLVGTSLTHSESDIRREFVRYEPPAPDASELIAVMRAATPGVTNIVDEATLYGEASLRIAPIVVATAGGRVTWARLGGGADDVAPELAFARSDITVRRTEVDILPSLALHAELSDRALFYTRYQQGFRPGGLAIESDFVRRFDNDRTATWEIGARYGRAGSGASARRAGSGDPFSLAVSLSHTDWRDIQADFVDGSGLPSTANIGDGRIWSASLSGAAQIAEGLRIEAGATWNHSRIDEPDLLLRSGTRQIPNIASFAGRIGANYSAEVASGLWLTADGWASYVGPSRLGIGPELGDRQGDYLDSGIDIRIGDEIMGVTFGIANLADMRGNRFSLGTPLSDDRDQVTPLRPRSFRLGIDRRF
ncbi:TonB-dependent receptor [Croceicoccus marinus]|uniref:TonB-dependent receptor n=1 Tax=Croceicoccus marinus TaxID=450378 RepID=A0A7G6VV98_9SPHN|nr:TonB-dependent receptor plug domain-containing protein [Croceicoccus marinus]QNE05663.1 TonB-dependent receptor [Croceicoccus marinus]